MRPETGPMQFDDDWPGVFIRGDEAIAMTFYLGSAIAELEKVDPIAAAALRGLQQTLASCDVHLKPEPSHACLVRAAAKEAK